MLDKVATTSGAQLSCDRRKASTAGVETPAKHILRIEQLLFNWADITGGRLSGDLYKKRLFSGGATK